jgi:gliding motility-associated-like protein
VNQPLNVIATATADAGGPYAICGETTITLNANANGGGQWTGGAGTYSDATLVDAIYTPLASEVGTIVSLMWTTNDPDGTTGPCTSADDAATITISTPATSTPLSSLTICSSSTAPLQVTTTPATGSWSGGAGTYANYQSATTTYTPVAADVNATNLNLVWTTSDPDGTGPCQPITVNQPLNVIATATADAGGPYAICGETAITLNANANGGGQWTGGAGTYSDATLVDAIYTPLSSEVGTIVSLMWTTNDPDGTTGPCTAADDDATITISTPANITAFNPLTICSSDVAQLAAVSTPASGAWTTAGGTGTFLNALNSQTTYTPGLNETGQVQIIWTTADPDGLTGPCNAVSETLELNVLQTSIAEIYSTYSVCANGVVSVSAQENGMGEWVVEPANAGHFADSSMSSTQFIPSVDLYTAQTLEIKWTTFDPDGNGPCVYDADSTDVGILPVPQINLAADYAIPCGDEISATVSTYQNATYTFNWNPQAGLIQPTQLITPVIQDNEYILSVTDANFCSNADTTVVDAIALYNMASAADAQTCLYVPVELSGIAANGQGPFTYEWVLTEEVSASAMGDNYADFVFDDYILEDSVLAITFLVSDNFGCTDDTVLSVTVFALPAIDPGQSYDLCEDSPAFTLTNFSPQPASGISGIWSPGIAVNPAQIGVNSVTYTYTFTDNNGCVNDSSMVVAIHEVPQPEALIPPVACVDTPVPLDNNSSCTTCGSVSFQWDFGVVNGTSTAVEPSFVYGMNELGLHTIELIATSAFGCDDTIQTQVDVVLPPVPLFVTTYNQPSCAPLAVDITNATDTAGLYLSYLWTIQDVGNYTSFLPPNVVLQQGDSILDYTIELMVENVCGQFATETVVSVLPQPVADILTSTVYGCTPLVVDFINESVGLPDAIEWDFGDGTFSGMDTPPPHTFLTDTTITIYHLAVALENECGVDTFFQEITVLPNTVNALFSSEPSSGCSPLVVTFTDFSTGASQRNFTLCDGATNSGQTFTHTFTEPGACEIQLVADNGCSFDTASVSIFIIQSPEPTIVADNSYCTHEPIEFTAANVGAEMLSWNFDDGSPPSTGNPINHTYASPGDYEVELVASNNLFGVLCEGSAVVPVHVSPNPQAEFSIPVSYGCSPFEVCFNNLSGTSDPNMLLSYQWNFDGLNTSVSQSPCFTYLNESGELMYQTITLEVSAMDIQYMQTCISDTSLNILVMPQPVSDFEMASDYTCYYPIELTTINTTTGGGAYQWQLNGQDAGQFTNGLFPINDLGVYTVDLIAMNQYGCTDISSQEFNSFPLPTLDFTFDLNDGCAPLMVQFENLSTGNNTYVWNLDDGTEANVQDVIHQYNFPGTYDVMLIGTTENNCTDTLTIEDPIRVYPVPVANFIFAPEEVNILNPQMTFEETGFGGNYYHWDFNDGSEDYGAIVNHSFNTPYYHAVTLTAYNQYGCTDDITKNVFVTDYLTVYVPSAFTPDDDNINDNFRPELGGKELVTRYKFWITDRWGNVLFETNDLDSPWTGNIRGGEYYASPDIYIWNVEAELKNGEEREYNGHVTLVR